MNNKFDEEWPLLKKWKPAIETTCIAGQLSSNSMKVLCAHLMECQFIYNRNLLAVSSFQIYTLPIIRKLCADLQNVGVSSIKIYETIKFYQTLQMTNYPIWEHLKITAFDVDISLSYTPIFGQDIESISMEAIYDEVRKRVLKKVEGGLIPCGPLLHILDPNDDVVSVYMRM